MQLIATLPSPSQPVDLVRALRDQLATTLPGLAAGSALMRGTDVSGPDWVERMRESTRASGAAWKAPLDMLGTVRRAAAQLGSSPLEQGVRQAITGAGQVADQALQRMGRAHMQFWSNPAQHLAADLVEYVAGEADRTAAAIASAIAAIDQLTS